MTATYLPVLLCSHINSSQAVSDRRQQQKTAAARTAEEVRAITLALRLDILGHVFGIDVDTQDVVFRERVADQQGAVSARV